MSQMVQNYFNDIQQRYNRQVYDPKQDALRTHVKAYKPKGHILETSPFSLSEAFKNDKESIKYFFDGIQGHGNDYSIGKINDTAIKLSGLGIAGMLAAGQGSPLKKGMEFVGLACWLGAMSLWPKLAINAPIKHFKGVDLNSEYVTSRGHKKYFYNDPQFICWDMISDSEIDKMGDKLGVPKNIKNRRKAIENKARQVAIQGNTLAMLTAGFATPLAASLVADKLGKHVLYPAILKMQENGAEKLQKQMAADVKSLVSDKKTELFIANELPEQITPKTMNGIRKMFAEMTQDKVLEAPVNSALNKIFSGKNIQNVEYVLDDNLIKRIVNECQQYNSFKVDVNAVVTELLKKYPDKKINGRNLPRFISNLGDEIIIKRIASPQNKEKIVENVQKMIAETKTFKLVSVDAAVDKLVDLSRILKTYNEKVHKMFNLGFYKKVWNGAVSVNAGIWEAMPQQIISAFIMDNKTLKALANAPSEAVANKILSGFVDKIVTNKDYYERVMSSLGKIAAAHSGKNEKYLKFSLDYLDDMQKLLTAYDAKGEISELTDFLNLMFIKRRRDILGKYASAGNTMFAPIRILSILKEAHGTPDYNILKKVLFENMSVDSFINRLDNLKEFIQNEDDYKRIVEKVFSALPSKTKELLPMGLGEKIDDLTTLVNHLLVNQSDDVNVKYALTDINKIKGVLKKVGLEKYVDDLFEVSFNNRDRLRDKVKEVISANPNKIDELMSVLKLTEDEASSIKLGDVSVLEKHLFGSSEVGKGFAENGRQKMRRLLEFVGTYDADAVGGFSVRRAKSRITNAMQATSFRNFMQDSAQKVLSYNGWFKRVGLAFAGLCAITAYGIYKIGKKNEFNPDIYEERRA